MCVCVDRYMCSTYVQCSECKPTLAHVRAHRSRNRPTYWPCMQHAYICYILMSSVRASCLTFAQLRAKRSTISGLKYKARVLQWYFCRHRTQSDEHRDTCAATVQGYPSIHRTQGALIWQRCVTHTQDVVATHWGEGRPGEVIGLLLMTCAATRQRYKRP